MNKAVLFLGVCAFILLAAGKNKQTDNAGANQSINPTLYSRFIQRKNQGIGSRGWFQFVYANEIYFLLAPGASQVETPVKDPLLYEIYEVCESVISKGANQYTYSSTFAGYLQSRFPGIDSGIKADVLEYEKKLFTVSNRLWNGKPLQ